MVLRDRINKNDTGFDFQVGNAFWLMLYTAVRISQFQKKRKKTLKYKQLHTGFLSYLVQTSDVAETRDMLRNILGGTSVYSHHRCSIHEFGFLV